VAEAAALPPAVVVPPAPRFHWLLPEGGEQGALLLLLLLMLRGVAAWSGPALLLRSTALPAPSEGGGGSDLGQGGMHTRTTHISGHRPLTDSIMVAGCWS